MITKDAAAEEKRRRTGGLLVRWKMTMQMRAAFDAGDLEKCLCN
jgi:hypothetical protein